MLWSIFYHRKSVLFRPLSFLGHHRLQVRHTFLATLVPWTLDPLDRSFHFSPQTQSEASDARKELGTRLMVNLDTFPITLYHPLVHCFIPSSCILASISGLDIWMDDLFTVRLEVFSRIVHDCEYFIRQFPSWFDHGAFCTWFQLIPASTDLWTTNPMLGFMCSGSSPALSTNCASAA